MIEVSWYGFIIYQQIWLYYQHQHSLYFTALVKNNLNSLLMFLDFPAEFSNLFLECCSLQCWCSAVKSKLYEDQSWQFSVTFYLYIYVRKHNIKTAAAFQITSGVIVEWTRTASHWSNQRFSRVSRSQHAAKWWNCSNSGAQSEVRLVSVSWPLIGHWATSRPLIGRHWHASPL